MDPACGGARPDLHCSASAPGNRGSPAPLPDGARNPSYSDYGITVLRQLDAHWSLGASLTHATNAAYYRATASYLDASDMLDVGGTRGIVTLQGSF